MVAGTAMVRISSMARTSQGSIKQLERRVFISFVSEADCDCEGRPEAAAGAEHHEECGENVDTGEDKSVHTGVVHVADQTLDEDIHVLPGGVVQVVVGGEGA